MSIKLFKTPRFLRWIFPRRTWGFSRKKNAVYLTFDDGPQEFITPWVLDLLKEKKIQATFFCVGNNIINQPEIVSRIKLEGHIIANHSMNHENGLKTNSKAYFNSIESVGVMLDNNLFRPPYGRLSSFQSISLSKKYKIIMWSWLSYDFDRAVSIEKILQKAKTQIKGGDIIVFHDNIKTFDRLQVLLPEVIEIIKSKNLSFELIRL